MKELKDYVCTLEQAKKLKELGIVQKSLFYWFDEDDDCGYSYLKTTKELLNNKFEKTFVVVRMDDYCSMPYDAECLEDCYTYRNRLNNSEIEHYSAFASQELIEIIANINDYALESYFDDVVYIKGENEAEQRAQFLIDYLKMIKKEEEQQNESNN